MNKCEKCGFLHWRTDPCREPKKSTGNVGGSAGRSYSVSGALPTESTANVPVDTKFNKQAWQRAYMREYRKGMRRTKMGNNKTDIMKAVQSLVGVIQAADSSPGGVTVFVPGSIVDYIDVIRERGASDGQDEMLLRFASANKLQRY